MAQPALVLCPGRERSLERRHPWVFAGAVAEIRGDPTPGDTVLVTAADGRPLARAAFSPASQIRARVWTFDLDERVDEGFLRDRVARAAAARSDLAERTDAFRLVHAESDRLPGVVADRYGPWVVIALTSAGAERWRAELVEALAGCPGVEGVFERSDVDVRRLEGLEPRTGVAAGEPPPRRIEAHEQALCVADAPATWWRFLVDLVGGQKTGLYLDQRDNRQVVARLARDRRVLDVFAYAGGFGMAAATAGAREVTVVDSSAPALALATETFEVNGLVPPRTVEANAFSHLRDLRHRGERFGLIVLDPPKLAHSQAQVKRAARAYKDLNLQAFHLLEPGGVLVSFSCSGAVSADLFQKIVFGAALDARRDVQVIGRLTQAGDHPVALTFPESEYLKGLVCRAA